MLPQAISRGFVIPAFFSALAVIASSVQAQVDYDIVYSRLPRLGDETRVAMPEVFDPISVGTGVDLMLLHPDRSE